jgi:hypothetical protein
MEHETDNGTAYRVNWDHLGIWQMQTIDSPTNGNQGGRQGGSSSSSIQSFSDGGRSVLF